MIFNFNLKVNKQDDQFNLFLQKQASKLNLFNIKKYVVGNLTLKVNRDKQFHLFVKY